jgi:hypothetical protein
MSKDELERLEDEAIEAMARLAAVNEEAKNRLVKSIQYARIHHNVSYDDAIAAVNYVYIQKAERG